MKVRIDNVTKKFGNTTAVSDFSAELQDGHLICLLGPSGCGKSTLLNMLCGIIPVTQGQIFFDDKDNMKMGTMSLFATFGNGEITERATESVTLTKSLKHILEILPGCKRNLPTIGESEDGKCVRFVREHDEEQMIVLILDIHALNYTHLTDVNTFWAVTTRNTQIGG